MLGAQGNSLEIGVELWKYLFFVFVPPKANTYHRTNRFDLKKVKCAIHFEL
jgi:hypothetical protein